MNDPTPEELSAIQTERARIFTPGWFGDLLGARLGFGDTFWIGNFGILLVLVPLFVLIGGVIYAQTPTTLGIFIPALIALGGLWRLAVLQALVRLRLKGARGGWTILGILWTAAEAIAALVYALFVKLLLVF